MCPGEERKADRTRVYRKTNGGNYDTIYNTRTVNPQKTDMMGRERDFTRIILESLKKRTGRAATDTRLRQRLNGERLEASGSYVPVLPMRLVEL